MTMSEGGGRTRQLFIYFCGPNTFFVRFGRTVLAFVCFSGADVVVAGVVISPLFPAIQHMNMPRQQCFWFFLSKSKEELPYMFMALSC